MTTSASSSAAAAVNDMLKESKAKIEEAVEECNGHGLGQGDDVVDVSEEEEDDDDDDFANGRKRKSRGKKVPAKKRKKAAPPQPKRQKYNDPEVSHLACMYLGFDKRVEVARKFVLFTNLLFWLSTL